MRGTGMCGWLAMTGRPDIKYAHSRISEHMANPCRGAFKALKHCTAYCKETRCFRQTVDGKDVGWSFYSDSDHARNAETQNERRSQLGRMAMLGSVPIEWGSKASSNKFGDDTWRTARGAAQWSASLSSACEGLACRCLKCSIGDLCGECGMH